MEKLRISALTFLILSHLTLILAFIFDNGNEEQSYIFYFTWIFGILSFFLNLFFGIEKKLNGILIVLLGISGVMWVFPFLLATFFGIPFIALFLGIAIYLHTKSMCL